ncbi:hypothetical protein SAMN05443575_2259 [Jatrophihabitans endophyticus]|uniref:Uncharacterized protein n=1 Tax=Jatrophihabitans endophyticus TaxID=1206085 RepID=A0A1M5KTW8_9ACTN|nr:hypothetical protein SAMN05443575_2259 [Jatrophihabitans endophyticus]
MAVTRHLGAGHRIRLTGRLVRRPDPTRRFDLHRRGQDRGDAGRIVAANEERGHVLSVRREEFEAPMIRSSNDDVDEVAEKARDVLVADREQDEI